MAHHAGALLISPCPSSPSRRDKRDGHPSSHPPSRTSSIKRRRTTSTDTEFSLPPAYSSHARPNSTITLADGLPPGYCEGDEAQSATAEEPATDDVSGTSVLKEEERNVPISSRSPVASLASDTDVEDGDPADEAEDAALDSLLSSTMLALERSNALLLATLSARSGLARMLSKGRDIDLAMDERERDVRRRLENTRELDDWLAQVVDGFGDMMDGVTDGSRNLAGAANAVSDGWQGGKRSGSGSGPSRKPSWKMPRLGASLDLIEEGMEDMDLVDGEATIGRSLSRGSHASRRPSIPDYRRPSVSSFDTSSSTSATADAKSLLASIASRNAKREMEKGKEKETDQNKARTPIQSPNTTSAAATASGPPPSSSAAAAALVAIAGTSSSSRTTTGGMRQEVRSQSSNAPTSTSASGPSSTPAPSPMSWLFSFSGSPAVRDSSLADDGGTPGRDSPAPSESFSKAPRRPSAPSRRSSMTSDAGSEVSARSVIANGPFPTTRDPLPVFALSSPSSAPSSADSPISASALTSAASTLDNFAGSSADSFTSSCPSVSSPKGGATVVSDGVVDRNDGTVRASGATSTSTAKGHHQSRKSVSHLSLSLAAPAPATVQLSDGPTTQAARSVTPTTVSSAAAMDPEMLFAVPTLSTSTGPAAAVRRQVSNDSVRPTGRRDGDSSTRMHSASLSSIEPLPHMDGRWWTDGDGVEEGGNFDTRIGTLLSSGSSADRSSARSRTGSSSSGARRRSDLLGGGGDDGRNGPMMSQKGKARASIGMPIPALSVAEASMTGVHADGTREGVGELGGKEVKVSQAETAGLGTEEEFKTVRRKDGWRALADGAIAATTKAERRRALPTAFHFPEGMATATASVSPPTTVSTESSAPKASAAAPASITPPGFDQCHSSSGLYPGPFPASRRRPVSRHHASPSEPATPNRMGWMVDLEGNLVSNGATFSDPHNASPQGSLAASDATTTGRGRRRRFSTDGRQFKGRTLSIDSSPIARAESRGALGLLSFGYDDEDEGDDWEGNGFASECESIGVEDDDNGLGDGGEGKRRYARNRRRRHHHRALDALRAVRDKDALPLSPHPLHPPTSAPPSSSPVSRGRSVSEASPPSSGLTHVPRSAGAFVSSFAGLIAGSGGADVTPASAATSTSSHPGNAGGTRNKGKRVASGKTATVAPSDADRPPTLPSEDSATSDPAHPPPSMTSPSSRGWRLSNWIANAANSGANAAGTIASSHPSTAREIVGGS